MVILRGLIYLHNALDSCILGLWNNQNRKKKVDTRRLKNVRLEMAN